MAVALCMGALPLSTSFTAAKPEVRMTAPVTSWRRTSSGPAAKHQATTPPPTSTVTESSQNAARSRRDCPGIGCTSMAMMRAATPRVKQIA
jgi:uncharacterized protein YfaP (DUF2135 family)